MIYEFSIFVYGIFFGISIIKIFYKPITFHCYEETLETSKKEFLDSLADKDDKCIQTEPIDDENLSYDLVN